MACKERKVYHKMEANRMTVILYTFATFFVIYYSTNDDVKNDRKCKLFV